MWAKVWKLLKETFSEWREDKATNLAAALSYYTIFSLPPLLIIVISIAGAVFGQDQVRQQIVEQIGGLVGSQGGEAVAQMIQGAQRGMSGVVATLIGIATLVFGATGVFAQLQEALNTMWEVAPEPGQGIWGVVKDRFLSFTMVLGIAFLLLVSLVVSTALVAFENYIAGMIPGSTFLIQLLNYLLSIGVITALFAAIFKVLPDARVAWRDVWIGAFVTALLFVLGKFLLEFYLGTRDTMSVYGAAGSLVLILLWVYYSAQILFLGAEFTQVYARTLGSRIAPDEDAIAVTEAARAQQGIPHGETLESATGQSWEGAAVPAPTARPPAPGSYRVPEGRRARPSAPPTLEFGPRLFGSATLLVSIFVGWLIFRD